MGTQQPQLLQPVKLQGWSETGITYSTIKKASNAGFFY